MDHGSKCNAIQNALQKAGVCISSYQASTALSELNKELTIAFRLRQKKRQKSDKSNCNMQSIKSCGICKRVDKSECGTVSASNFNNESMRLA